MKYNSDTKECLCYLPNSSKLILEIHEVTLQQAIDINIAIREAHSAGHDSALDETCDAIKQLRIY